MRSRVGESLVYTTWSVRKEESKQYKLFAVKKKRKKKSAYGQKICAHH